LVKYELFYNCCNLALQEYISVYTVQYHFVVHQILYRIMYKSMSFVAATRKY